MTVRSCAGPVRSLRRTGQQRQERFQSRRESIFLRQPRLRQIEGELRATMSRIIASALRRGTDPLPAVEVLREENLGLQEEKRRLLAQMGLPEDALEEKPACPLCGDSGYRGGQVCRCLRKYYAREQQKELSRMLDLGGQSFETFSLSWYSDTYDPALGISPRKNMARILEICRSYAETFSQDSGSLLLTEIRAWARPSSPPPSPGGQRRRLVRGVRYRGPHFPAVRGPEVRPGGRGRSVCRRGAGAGLRSADPGRSGHGNDHGLCPERPVPDRQHPGFWRSGPPSSVRT